MDGSGKTASGNEGDGTRPAAPDEAVPDGFRLLSARVEACRACPLGESRVVSVFGAGNPNADLVFIGEAPGAREDKTGIPFTGAAGNLLMDALGRHGISREEVFITNILKCRPPGNRDPKPAEIAACTPFLLEQFDLLKPRMLCALGRVAAGWLLGEPVRIMQRHGSWEHYAGLPLFICLHPAAVLHSGKNRPLFESDVAALAKAYHGRNTSPQPVTRSDCEPRMDTSEHE